MILIIEGTDGTGKSTFAEYAAAKTGATLLHAGPPTERSWLREYINPLTHTNKPHFVLDRWHMGEMIWPSLFNRRSSLFRNMEEFNDCNRILNLFGARMMIVARRKPAIKKTLADRGEVKSFHLVANAQDRYIALAPKVQRLDVSVIDSDTLHKDPERILQFMLLKKV